MPLFRLSAELPEIGGVMGWFLIGLIAGLGICGVADTKAAGSGWICIKGKWYRLDGPAEKGKNERNVSKF